MRITFDSKRHSTTCRVYADIVQTSAERFEFQLTDRQMNWIHESLCSLLDCDCGGGFSPWIMIGSGDNYRDAVIMSMKMEPGGKIEFEGEYR